MQHTSALAIQLQEQLQNIFHDRPAVMRTVLVSNGPSSQRQSTRKQYMVPRLYRKEETACDLATD